MPGQTLDSAWPRLHETDIRVCIQQISLFCEVLSTMKASFIAGVDGKYLPEGWLANDSLDPDDRCSHENLLQNCKNMQMDCSEFVLHYCDLGPGNVLVDVKSGVVSVIDFECVGYVPIEWIRTKFRVCGGMDLAECDQQGEDRLEWRAAMEKELELKGYQDVSARWMEWFKGRKQ